MTDIYNNFDSTLDDYQIYMWFLSKYIEYMFFGLSNVGRQ